jgi:hypothetical protein
VKTIAEPLAGFAHSERNQATPAAASSGPKRLAGLNTRKPTPHAMSAHPVATKAAPAAADAPANENDGSLLATCSENTPSAMPEAEIAARIALRAMRQS